MYTRLAGHAYLVSDTIRELPRETVRVCVGNPETRQKSPILCRIRDVSCNYGLRRLRAAVICIKLDKVCESYAGFDLTDDKWH